MDSLDLGILGSCRPAADFVSSATATEGQPAMPGERQPSRPIDAYKEIIDQLVTETSYGVREKLVVREGAFSQLSDDRVFNSFVQTLSIDQRRILAQMLHAERTAAIGDVLAVLSWWVLARGVGFTFRGEPMPVDLSGMGLHGDYVGRQDDWEWPKDNDPAAK